MADFELPDADADGRRDRFNGAIAIAVALIAAFMAVSKVKDDNVVQAMQKAQVAAVDTWNQYQAKRLRQFTLDTNVLQLEASHGSAPATPEQVKLVETWKQESDRYKADMVELSTAAKGYEAAYDAGNNRDDLFDLSDALLSLGLALFAVTALTRVRWLFGLAGLTGVSGIVFGVAAFNGWTQLHPDWLISFLN